MTFWKRTLPLLIAFVLGLTFTAQYYIPHPVSEALLTEASVWNQIIAGFAFIVALQSTMFSLLAFFVASAAYRAFRARSPEASVLLLAAIIVMAGRVPLGEYLLAGLGQLSDWIMQVPNTAAQRAILIGVSLGGIATSIKIIFGIERAYLGGEDE